MIPSMYDVIAIIWGPQPGMSPIAAARMTAITPSPFEARSDSDIPPRDMAASNTRYAERTQKVTNAVSEAAWVKVSSREFSLSPIVASVSSAKKLLEARYRMMERVVPIMPTHVSKPSLVDMSHAISGE